jgi:3-methyladenine DNA glycosylase/8-oxoguanine DNA glycosylase
MEPVVLPAHGLDLPATVAPVAWAKGRWPTCDVIGGTLIWRGRVDGRAATVTVTQPHPDRLVVTGLDAAAATAWVVRHLGWGAVMPNFDEPLIADLATAMPGLRPWALGGLAHGVLASIIGQSISVQAAAAVEARVAAIFAPPVELAGRRFWAFPTPEQFAAAEPARLREAGLTWRKAGALVAGGRLIADGALPDDVTALGDPDTAIVALRALPLVGPWTAASALLWGLGAGDAHPTGDVALLRAYRTVSGSAETTLRDLDAIAERWRPHRGWAARLLWTRLLGRAF